jgi:3-oxoacyl-[acyl-carrier protein] reductase
LDLQLKGKRAVVTGSSSGIGEATARLLASEGATVIVHGRDETKTASVAHSIKDAGGNAFVCVADLSLDEGAQKLIAFAQEAMGGVDILVNNAGIPEFTSWMDTTTEQWMAIYNNNVLSMVRMIQGLVPGMKTHGWGRVINIGSVVGTQPFSAKPHYCAARAAILNLTLSLAKEVAETGITVNTVSPGVVLTPPARKYFLKLAAERGWGSDWSDIERNVLKQRLYNQTGRLGRPEDVANLIAFLCSPLSDYINGANYRIDGGTTGTLN